MLPPPLADTGNVPTERDTATTGAPAVARAVAIPWPSPRLAPTTIVVLPDRSLIALTHRRRLLGRARAPAAPAERRVASRGAKARGPRRWPRGWQQRGRPIGSLQ